MDATATSSALPEVSESLAEDSHAGSHATDSAGATDNAGLAETNATATGELNAESNGKCFS